LINVLLGILNPRELPKFQESIDKINNIDKLRIKYFQPEADAYYSLRLWFLHHPEYSHLCLCPDDVLFTEKEIQTLIDDIQKFNPPVITGFSNINLTDQFNDVTLSLYPEPTERAARQYQLLTKQDLTKMPRYFQVKWQGFSLTTIRRDIVERIEFDDDSKWNGQPYGSGCCLDTVFSYNCNIRGIPMICDQQVQIVHLREGRGSLMTNFFAGIKKRSIVLERASR
jgi:hypothetical protein